MKKAGKQFAQLFLKISGILGGLLLLYVLAFVGLGLLPQNKSFAQSPDGIEVMVIDNGVHTDLVLPLKTKLIDWREYLPVKDYAGVDSSFTHVGFGWGNRRFYMETPEWKDLNLSVALSAALGLGKSAMHVYYFPKIPKAGKNRILLKISEAQYAKLVSYILHSFKQYNGRFMLIEGKGYTPTDNFYEANGRFSVIKTCNGWTNGALKKTGIKTVFWAPLPHFMMGKLRDQQELPRK